MIWFKSPFIPISPTPLVSSCFFASLCLSPSWILSSTSNIHSTQHTISHALGRAHTHTQASIWTFNKRTWRTLTLAHSVLCTSTHTFTHIRTVVPVIYMLQEKEPAQTKRPWKFNTYSVQWIHKQTHTEPWVCASIDSPHLFLYSHLLKFNLQDVKWVLLLSCLYHLYF